MIMNKMFDGLFEYTTLEKLDEFIKNADEKSALDVIEASIQYCQQSGAYTLEESYLLFKMLNKLKEK